MTKANDFKMNTDYLALAEVSRGEFTATFASEILAPGAISDRRQDFNSPTEQGAIDRYLFSINGSDFYITNYVTDKSENPDASIKIYAYRSNPSTITIRCKIKNWSSSQSYTAPTQIARIRVSSFKPPNVL